MSFLPPQHSDIPELESEMGRERERQLEERATRYSELHPDGPEPGISTRLLGRLRRLLGRSNG